MGTPALAEAAADRVVGHGLEDGVQMGAEAVSPGFNISRAVREYLICLAHGRIPGKVAPVAGIIIACAVGH